MMRFLGGQGYTLAIAAAVAAALAFPGAFLHWGPVDLRSPWLVLLVVQMVMFGMGTQMSLRDFEGVARMPRGLAVGLACHFTVMPLVGFALTRLFDLHGEIAAGVILIGSCSSGLASNVMAYLARANLGLSVTVTAVTTLAAPFLTPLLMRGLAGTFLTISVPGMMMEILRIVLVPIGAALFRDALRHAAPAARRRFGQLVAACALALAFLACGGWSAIAGHFGGHALTAATIPGFLAGAVLAGWVFHRVTLRWPGVEGAMPYASMAGIVYFTAVTTAAGRDNLLRVGGVLLVVSILHNAAGYGFGYWLSRGCGLDRNSARTVSFEVGLQDGGMASGIAAAMGKLGTVGLAPAIFSPWMNLSGSLLAGYWRRRPVPQATLPS